MKPLTTFPRVSLSRIGALLVGAMLVPLSPTVSARPWADTAGRSVEAEYVSSTVDSVTIRQAGGQVLRLRLADLSAADRDFVAKQQIAEKEAQMIDVVVVGEVLWRLPSWNNLSWSSPQPGELWAWDEVTKTATKKLADVKVNYPTDGPSSRTQITGKFKTDAPVRLPKTGKFVVKAKFNATVNGKAKDLEDTSAPMSLPPVKNGVVDLPSVRLSVSR